MSDDEIRDLLDRGVQDPDASEELTAEQLWSAGRRRRTRGRAWIGGLGAAAAAASILGVVWAQGLAGGDAAPPPADKTPNAFPGPTVGVDGGARGEPFFARFESADSEPAAQLSGVSRPATLDDLQGTWHGPDTEVFVFEGNEFTATLGGCSVQRRTVALTPESRLRTVGPWEGADDVGECLPEQPLIPWGPALNEEPLLSLDGGTLVISGLDGTTEEPRIPVALTLASTAPFDSPSVWRDTSAQTGLTPIALGEDVELTVVGTTQDAALSRQEDSNLFVSGIGALTMRQQDRCDLGFTTSLRSDGVLLAGDARPLPECSTGTRALPAAAPSEAALHLLRSGPTLGVEGASMVIRGTVPESLLGSISPPVDHAPTSEPPESAAPTEDATGTETPTSRDDMPLVVGTPTVVVMSEGEWAPSGELTPLTAEKAVDRRWLMVEVTGGTGVVSEPLSDYGLTFDESALRVRECSVDVTVPGDLRDGVFVATGEPAIVEDPDPWADCPVPVYTDEWVQILTAEPRMSTDGRILVVAGHVGDQQLEPLGLALLPEGADRPVGGPTTPVTQEDLTGGLSEVPARQAVDAVGVSDVRDPQPAHATRLSVADGVVTVDVGCTEPLRGPAWYSQMGPDDADWQLTAVLPDEPDCQGAASDDARMWRQLLAHGAFLHRFGDYVIVDSWVDPRVTPAVSP